ncbi:MAG: ABC transporter ATP-binding protein [Alphaproteobacteria bacterium]|nr:ABC transporter ATP-binding protein [Alphaproteobacteria bacterium]
MPSPTDTAEVPRLQLRGITKAFPGCLANDQVDLDVRPGEIHALLGENGAGKSTLVKIVDGVLKADAGEILWEGRPVTISSPAEARALGIGMVFQHFSLFESLTVAENIALGIAEQIPIAELNRRIGEISARYGLALTPERHVHALSVGERQRVEIVRSLLQDPQLLIMDEPTSVLTPQEVETLFDTLRRLAREGRSVLYISHKLEEIRTLCDRATILRGGRVVATCDPKQETARSLAEMMIGRELQPARRDAARPAGKSLLRVSGLTLASANPHGCDLKDISFEVRAGELFGIAGVAGNGQAELLAALSGETHAASPDIIEIDGEPVGDLGPRRRRARGLAFVPEERLGHGSVPDLSLTHNALLSGYDRLGLIDRGFIRFGRARDYAEKILSGFNVVSGGARTEARGLSGGNLQKFILGREILQKPRIMIAAHPTWGVDAGAAGAIRQALIDLAHDGAAVVVVSQDLDEIFEIADRIAVIFHGRLSPAYASHALTVERVGLLMGGVFEDDGAADRRDPQTLVAHGG